MTLGDYIARLEKVDPSTKIPVGLGNPHSWRGTYSELAFEIVKDTTIGEMLVVARSAIGTTYQGWKGGEYTMDENTSIHVDEVGCWTDGNALWRMFLDLMLFNSNEDKSQ